MCSLLSPHMNWLHQTPLGAKQVRKQDEWMDVTKYELHYCGSGNYPHIQGSPSTGLYTHTQAAGGLKLRSTIRGENKLINTT